MNIYENILSSFHGSQKINKTIIEETRKWYLPTAGDIDREPDDELFGDEIGLIDWLFCWSAAPGCEDALFGGKDCDCCWLFDAKLEAFSVELFCTAAAAAAAASAYLCERKDKKFKYCSIFAFRK
jgi:hypothetical protein